MQFVPSHLRIEKGSTVTWKVCPDTNSSGSFYGMSSRSHILMFEEIFVESPKLELAGAGRHNDSFSLNFQDLGMFPYECCIYSRMRGCIEVTESEKMMPF